MLSSYNSVTLTASGLIKTGPGQLHSLTIAGTANATATIYNNTAGSGTVIWEIRCLANSQASAVLDVVFSKGAYVDLSGAGVTFSCSYG